MDPIDIIAQTHDDGPRGIVTRGTALEIVRRLKEAGFHIVEDDTGQSPLGDVADVITSIDPTPTPLMAVAKKRAKKAEASE